jgi:murein L,D-transpeptidase YcbB/YkuD
MYMNAVRFWAFLSALVCANVTSACSQSTPALIKQAVYSRLSKEEPSFRINGKNVCSYNHGWLKTFYQRRSFAESWFSHDTLRAEATDLVRALRRASLEGLNPSDYDLDDITHSIRTVIESGKPDPRARAVTDVLLTNAFLHYASDLYSGRINPNALSDEWSIRPGKRDVALLLQHALDSTGIQVTLDQLTPQNKKYEDLKKALARFRSLPAAPEPPKITRVRRLAKGDSSAHVVALRKRISFWSPEVLSENEVFDDTLEQAVKRFQRDNGIEPDGVTGPETIAALNLTHEQRIQSIVVNLERCRWLARDVEQRSIVVNIPDFELAVKENGISTERMRVVVGKPDHRTPVLNNAMTYLVLGPCWYVPETIAAKEIAPMMAKDPDYLKKERIRAFQNAGEKVSEVDSGSVDVADVESGKVRLRMEPGRRNSLGTVKFMFPNQNSVYLHDTPAKRLFSKTMRQFSHGCVRVERPVELAAYLLGKDTLWVKEAIHKALRKREEHVVRLPEPVPVHLQYFTVWVNDEGSVQFRKDIYHWDNLVSMALNAETTLQRKTGVEQFASEGTDGRRVAAVQ